jgi:MFS family permease
MGTHPSRIRGETFCGLAVAANSTLEEVKLDHPRSTGRCDSLYPASMEARAAPDRIEQPWPSPRRAWYALAVLTVALMVATIDRSILSLLVGPIKHDLGVTDTQMSLLLGMAFVSIYAFLGLPIARLADVHSRRLIIGIGIAFWSAMTTLSGFVHTYLQLFLARVGVGAGEASFAPATYSMLTDSFPREKLPRAMAVIGIGFSAGSGLALILGGWVIHLVTGMPPVRLPVIGTIHPWQLVFFVVGLPGLLLAAAMATVQEPTRRGLMAADPTQRARALPIKQIFAFLRAEKSTYVPIFLAMGVKSLLLFGVTAWTPTFFVRTYGWTMPQIGFLIGLIQLLVAPVGLLSGGWLAERYAKQGLEDANMRVVLIASAAALPASILFPLMPTAAAALTGVALVQFIASIGIAPANAALQIITPNQMRGQVSALYMFIFNIVGYGLGPTAVALFTDYVFHAESALRYSITAVAAITTPLAVLIVWCGLKPYGRSVLRASHWHGG